MPRTRGLAGVRRRAALALARAAVLDEDADVGHAVPHEVRGDGDVRPGVGQHGAPSVVEVAQRLSGREGQG